MIVIDISSHVVLHHLVIAGAHEAGQQSRDKTSPVLALGAVDQIGALIGGKELQALSKAGLEVVGGKINTQIQGLHLPVGKQGLIVGRVKPFRIDIALNQLVGIRQIHHRLDTVCLGQIVGIGRPAQLIVHRAAAAEEGVLAQFAGGNIPEVSKNSIGSVVLPNIGAGELMDEVLVTVALLLVHGDGHSDVLQSAALRELPGVASVLRRHLFRNTIGSGKVPHVDGGNEHTLAVPQDQGASVHIGVVGAKGHLIFPLANSQGHDVTIGVACLLQVCRVNVQHQVAILLDLRNTALKAGIGGLFSVGRQSQAQSQNQRQQQGSCFFHTNPSLHISRTAI